MENKKKKLTGQQGELMRALDITPDDLEANDNGIITEHQRESLMKRQSYMWQPYRVSALALAAMGLIFPILIQQFGDEPLVAVIMAFVLLGVALGLEILQAGIKRGITIDLSKNRIETVQGIAVVNISEDASVLEINGRKLKASQDVLRRIKHLDPYVVHYLPTTDVILSMQHIPDNDNIREDVAASRLVDTSDEIAYYEDSEQSGIQSKM